MQKKIWYLIPVILVIAAFLSMAIFTPVIADDEENPPVNTEPTEEVTPPPEDPVLPEEVVPPLEETLPTEEVVLPTEDVVPPTDETLPTEEVDPPIDDGALLDGGFAPMMMLMGAPQGRNGTTLSGTISVTPHWTRTWFWTISKSANPTSVTLYNGDFATSTYTVSLVKDHYVDDYWVDGTVCVTNGGDVDTESLTIVVQVEYNPPGGGGFVNLEGVSHTITPDELAAGTSGCYPYSISFVPTPGMIYRNTAHITILNHSGHLDVPFGPNPKTDGYYFPAVPTEIYASVHVTDTNGEAWVFDGTGSVSYTRTFVCGNAGTHDNTATISETGQSASAEVTVTCIQTNGCTLTIGYWKTHAGFGPQKDAVSQLLPIVLGWGGGKSINVGTNAFAVTILSMNLGDPSNGITKLYAQLLGAKLNIANGAGGAAVAAVIANADSFLVGKNWQDWSTLSKTDKNKVLLWMSMLDQFNNGLIGPGHCGP